MVGSSAAPTLDKATRLNVGDVVSVAVGVFGKDYAISRGASPWHSEAVRDEGEVTGRQAGKWLVRFRDGVHKFERKALSFVRKAAGAGRCAAAAVEANSDDEEAVDSTPQAPLVDSSDEDVGVGEAEHEGGRAEGGYQALGDWSRDDKYGLDERSKHGYMDQSGPRISGLTDWEKSSLFALGTHFLPMDYLTEMARQMEAKGVEKFEGGDRTYKNWAVNRDDVIQWIGVWLYMLAYPQSGDRRAYFTEPSRGFGPRHRLAEYLKLGANGEREKGLRWFEMMHACFAMPEYPNTAHDPFHRTRRFWDALRDAFSKAVTASWLIVMDESMVQWQGRGMPGLMVILRKPTPIGLELHTLCDAMSGILLWFEVYEGKEAMSKKEFNDQYPKSVALTLRMVKPFFGTGRVLIADSWFGSVACAIALFAHGIFAVMNVKTATKGYPKEQLMAVVDEIKGKSEEARAARRARRGKQIAFIRSFKVGSRNLTLIAGGHNKKVPLLLIASYGSMLPGDEHVKTWQVNKSDGTVEYVKLTTAQPQIHALYRRWMNIIDVHNKLRQGVVSMADVWHTRSWAERHFAEGIGFWEVNVFKALTYFYPCWKNIAHGEFRSRLAWEMMTLGKEPYPKDMASSSDVTIGMARGEAGQVVMPIAPLLHGEHHYERHPSHSKLHRCAYCGKPSYFRCITCETNGLGVFSVCGPKASRVRECRKRHVAGEQAMHATFIMREESREKIAIARRKRAMTSSDADDVGGGES